jgi:hypothetical protein
MPYQQALNNDQVLSARVRIPAHVVHRSFAVETVVLNLSTGKYHALNPTAGRMLETLEETGSVQETARRLSEDFGVPAERVTDDVLTLCRRLATRGLIETEVGGGD